ncbi:MAG: hypothetical protein LQ351_004075 [Letrouitia transgressa]|nr:MAG: hypothetical protein LQ351_004075 [Letrouitia transgressa]
MASHICSIVPPHLLRAMADSQDPDARQLAANTINTARNLHDTRHSVFAAKLARLHFGHDGHDAPDEHSASAPQSIIPNALLEHISKADDVDDAVKESAARSLTLSQKIRDDRQAVLGAKEAAVKAEIFHRGVYDMQHRGDGDDSRTFRYLPGKVIRVEGQPLVKDKNVNEAYDNCLKVLEFYKKVFDYNSLDNKNMPVISSVHFAQNYGNAFWFDSKKQMVYGDGDKFLYNFTGCIDVIGHEMTHAVTFYNSNLQYVGESGALNEHVSDVFGTMVKQMNENTTAQDSDWLIGEGCLMPDIKGVALRNMKAPGTAYNDPKIGADIQPDHYSQIQDISVKYADAIENDNGGVHILSGIPNKAFALSALAFGGYSWEKAGKIWWQTVTTHRIPPTCTFIQFADVTVDVAEALFGEEAAKTVRAAWNEVGVARKF